MTSPIPPSCRNFIASRIARCERHCVPTWQMRPYLRAAAIIAVPSAMSWQTGFSTYTSLPACMAQMRTQSVPVVGRRGADQIDRRVLECLAHVPHEFRLDPLLFGDLFAPAEPYFLVGIDQVQDHRSRIAEKSADVIAAPAAHADDGHAQFTVGVFGLGDMGSGGKSGGRSHRSLQETTAVDSGHGILLRRKTERLTRTRHTLARRPCEVKPTSNSQHGRLGRIQQGRKRSPAFRKSRASGRTSRCRDCHLPLQGRTVSI